MGRRYTGSRRLTPTESSTGLIRRRGIIGKRAGTPTCGCS